MSIETYINENLMVDAETGAIFWKVLSGKRSMAPLGTKNRNGYIRICVMDKNIYAHRLVWFLTYGKWPEGQIDHINRIRDDNRPCNLQEVTNRQNAIRAGLSAANSSGYRGVSLMKKTGKYLAQVRVHGKLTYFGQYDTAEEANRVVTEARCKLFSKDMEGKFE